MSGHPETGQRFIVVMPLQAHSYRSVVDSYLANQTEWLSVIDTSDFPMFFERHRDDDVTFVHWAQGDLGTLPTDRRAVVTAMYFEAYDPDLSRLHPDHKKDFDHLVEIASTLDAVGVHTPWMADELSRHVACPTFVLPHGLDAIAMGTPVWGSAKTSDAAFYGSGVGKRRAIIDTLVTFGMGRGYMELTGTFGPTLIRELNHTKCVLNIYHYDVASYSTWRLFQAACASAALITEDGDIWPLSRENCVVLKKPLTPENVYELVCLVNDFSHGHATVMAENAYEEMRKYTIPYCVDNYLVPGTRGLRR